MDLEMRHLRYFKAVAEELSFTRAAERLHMAQPPLSRAIQTIENELGVTLLQRTTRRVALTAAGSVLLDEARRLLHRFDEAMAKTIQAGRIDRRDLRIGFRPAASLPLLEPVVRDFWRRFPEVAVDTIRIEWTEQIDCTVDGRADVAFVLCPLDDPRIDVTPLLAAPRAVAMPNDHPLADRDDLSIADLREYPLAVPAGARKDWKEFWTAAPREIGPGVPPPPTVSNADESLAVVLSGRALVIAISTVTTYYKDSSLTILPIRDIAPAVIGLASRRKSDYATVSAFREIALNTAETVARELAQETGTAIAGPGSIASLDLSRPLESGSVTRAAS